MTEATKAAAPAKKEMVTDVFVRGANQGWGIATRSMIPNVLMAFVIIKILNITGVMTIIGDYCGPLMAIFGLPGKAIVALLAGWLSMGGGVSAASALYESGAISGADLGIIAPAMFLMGSQVQYMGRCLGVIGIEGKMIPITMCIPVIVAFIALWVMKLIVLAA